MSPDSPSEPFFNVLKKESRHLMLFQLLDGFMQGQDPMLLLVPLVHLSIIQESATVEDFARFSTVVQGHLPGEYHVSLPLSQGNTEVVAAFQELVKTFAYSKPQIEDSYIQNNRITLGEVQFPTRLPREIVELYRLVIDDLQRSGFDKSFLYRRHQRRREELHPSLEYIPATEDTPAHLTLGYSTRRRTSALPPIPFEK